MFLVFTANQSSRLDYILDFVFTNLLGVAYKVTTDKEEFKNSSLPKINYSFERISDEFFVPSTRLLFSKQIVKQTIEFSEWKSMPVFFQVNNGDLPFDIFAASFFLVSRYEEYLAFVGDKFGRFKAEDSTSFRGSFLETPVVNKWVLELGSLLKLKYPSIEFELPTYSFTPTIDIDNAYAYKYKGLRRVSGGLLSKLIKFKFKRAFNRISVHMGFKVDPYDSYDKQEYVHKKFNIKPLYFILLGDYSTLDRNISHKNKNLIQLIKRLGDNATLGIHPSYGSNKKEGQVLIEKQRLEHIAGVNVEKSRQHYIKMKLPFTYNKLIAAGIKEDYSMGFPGKTGFRASTCTPFMFYDLERDIKTELKIHPFVAMDSTLKYYAKFKEKEVIPFLRPIVNEIKRVGGNFVFVFHNESIGDQRNWKNWGDIYEKVIKLSIEELED